MDPALQEVKHFYKHNGYNCYSQLYLLRLNISLIMTNDTQASNHMQTSAKPLPFAIMNGRDVILLPYSEYPSWAQTRHAPSHP